MRAAFKNKKHSNFPVDQWPAAAADMLPRLDFQSLLHADARANSTTVGPSTIPEAGRGRFAAKALNPGHSFLPFLGQCIYRDFDTESTHAVLKGRLYGADCRTRALAASAKRWQENSIALKTTNSFWPDREAHFTALEVSTKSCYSLAQFARSVWIVPVPFPQVL